MGSSPFTALVLLACFGVVCADWTVLDPSHPLAVNGSRALGVMAPYGYQEFTDVTLPVVFMQGQFAFLLCTGPLEYLSLFANGTIIAVAFPVYTNRDPHVELYPVDQPAGCAYERMLGRCLAAGCKGFAKLLDFSESVPFLSSPVPGNIFNGQRNKSFITGEDLKLYAMEWDIGQLFYKYFPIPGGSFNFSNPPPLPPTLVKFSSQWRYYRWIGFSLGTAFMVIFCLWIIGIVVLASVAVFRHCRMHNPKHAPYLALLVLCLEIFINTCRFTFTVYDPYLLGRYPVWLMNLAGTYGCSFAAMNALLVALWWISSYIVVLGHSLRNARPLAKVCVGVVTAIICVGIGITEYGVGFYYAFATKGDQDDLAVRLVPSSVVLLLCGLFFLCSGVLVLSVLCRGAQFKAANKSKALIRIAAFIVLTSFFLLFAGSFIYAFMNASYMSETAGNFGIRTTWYAVMLAISTCNIWIFRVRTAEYKKKRQETLSTASGTEDGGKLKVDLFACCRRGVPSIYESKNSSSGVSRAETASTSVSVPSSSSPQTVSSSPQTGEDLLSEFESTAILL